MANSAGTDSLHRGPECPRCLVPMNVATGDDPLVFYCRNGHSFPMAELLRLHAGAPTEAFLSLVRAWEVKVGLLRAVAARAEGNGFPSVAATVRVQAHRLEGRMRVLRRAVDDNSSKPTDAQAS